MTTIGQTHSVGQYEKQTQQQVIDYFVGELGYQYLGNWKDRENNSNIEEELLKGWLKKQGHSDTLIERAVQAIVQESAIGGSVKLYDANQRVYNLLRYSAQISPAAGEKHENVYLIDWKNPENNDFAIAEEVTIKGQEHTKRPDLVMYVNGIALGVIELKRSTVSVDEGIRQNLSNQKKEFIENFFSTIQLVMAGNWSEGMRYGVIQTPAKYFLDWKEEGELFDRKNRNLLQELSWVCSKQKLLEIIHDFVVFDAGIKKTCRPNQYFGVKAAQERVKQREGGIIWHTQGSGKSLTMVWLAKWLRDPQRTGSKGNRVLIITDRTELDEQIEKVFNGVNEHIYRTDSAKDLINKLNSTDEWLMCTLIHKFGKVRKDDDVEGFIGDIKRYLPKDFSPKGEMFVFVDECHRTQSGKLHGALKELLPNAMIIGFTGTPLLKKDKAKSIEVFGSHIHTYKYDQAVEDKVVLDLRYEARNIDQNLGSKDKIDIWFKSKTKGLSDWAKAQLKQRWGTMQKLLSSKERLQQIVLDILFDMETKDRLKSGHGNALLVVDSIYQACRVYQMFQETELKDKCAIVSSYDPNVSDINKEETGEGKTEQQLKYDVYRKMIANYYEIKENKVASKVSEFEKDVKKKFIEQPAQMKLLIVVDKLLTGFDAPPATYLYIDKKMQDHGLFQAICRVNRLDSDDKEYGYVVDYKDLFKSLQTAITDYTGEAFGDFDAEDVKGLLNDRIVEGNRKLEEARESIKALCEPVLPPKDTEAYLAYFCFDEDSDVPDRVHAIKHCEQKRVLLYQLTGKLLRAYAELANDMDQAGYTPEEVEQIKQEIAHYEQVRKEVKLASCDYIDMKIYEPAMRHLLDSYVSASESKVLSTLDDMTLVDLIVERGEAFVDDMPKGTQSSEKAMAETIENNVRRVIIDEAEVNPAYYERMSKLLDELILKRKQQAISYEKYLKQIVDLTKKVVKPDGKKNYPKSLKTSALRNLYDNLGQDEELAIKVDCAVRKKIKADFRNNPVKRKRVQAAVHKVLEHDKALAEKIFQLVLSQRDY
ncbi:Type-1 restriction enzyme R protein [Poriferisphaera corsica]|uniref:Type I restriction enzyme endonuclease subunit n=1 Tax=Poriferisphaera corsica TaxID=2528020 RepID=A0A517YPR5_9BACT|nr:type I restriction endonuclease subunit R [Poriferisphaera corsica]QDU32206.1 Type-1 restriction enzyme R protein [Poriferisphaera corsica]